MKCLATSDVRSRILAQRAIPEARKITPKLDNIVRALVKAVSAQQEDTRVQVAAQEKSVQLHQETNQLLMSQANQN